MRLYWTHCSGGDAIWSDLLELAVLVLLAWLVSRFIAGRLTRPSQPAEPGDLAGSPARLRPRPKMGAGAVALAEPDEEDEEPIGPRYYGSSQR